LVVYILHIPAVSFAYNGFT